MTTEQQTPSPAPVNPTGNGWRTFGIVVITIAITVGVGYWLVSTYLFPTSFTPVVLNAKDQQRLDQKLERLGGSAASVTRQTQYTDANAEPEAYSEIGASREIHFTEKELNAMLASGTDLGSRLLIDLSDNLASAKLLVDLDPDFPLLGGKTLKVTAGMQISLIDGKPSAVLKGVSVWGVPLPNAWLGNMKNSDLSREFGQSGGFWQALNEGIEEIEVEEGKLRIKLRE